MKFMFKVSFPAVPTSSWKLWLWNSGLRLRRRVEAWRAVGYSGGRLARTNTPPILLETPEIPSTVTHSIPEEDEKSRVKWRRGAGLEGREPDLVPERSDPEGLEPEPELETDPEP